LSAALKTSNMGILSPELQVYAENIWRRFPEVFISLGAPDAIDDDEDPSERCWHRVRDSCHEKVIEVVMPKRGKVDPFSMQGDEEAAAQPALNLGIQFSNGYRAASDDRAQARRSHRQQPNSTLGLGSTGNLGAAPLVPGKRPGAAGSPAAVGSSGRRDAHAELQQLAQVVTAITESLPTSVSREVRSQLHSIKRRMKSEAGDRSLRQPAATHSLGSDAIAPAGRQMRQQQQQQQPPIRQRGGSDEIDELDSQSAYSETSSRASSSRSATSNLSSLAERRGKHLPQLQTRGKPYQMAPGVRLVSPDDDGQDSPGARIQQTAARRRTAQGTNMAGYPPAAAGHHHQHPPAASAAPAANTQPHPAGARAPALSGRQAPPLRANY